MMQRYTRDQAFGYLIISLKSLGKDDEEIRKIINKTTKKMDIWSEEFAEETYDEF